MSKNVTYAQFDLRKVKSTKKGLEVIYYDLENSNKELTAKSNDLPHPDFSEVLKQFAEPMAEVLGLLEGWEFAREHNRNNEEALKKAIQGGKLEVQRCVPSGVIFKGEGESEGIQITGSLSTDFGSIGMSTGRIVFCEADGEFTPKCESLAEELKKEVWAYLFKGKKAQTELFGGDEEKPKGGLNVA